MYGNGELEGQLYTKVKHITLYKQKYNDLSNFKKNVIPLKVLLMKNRIYKKYIKKDYDVEIAFLEGDVDILKMFRESKDQSYLSDKQLRHILGNHMVTLVSKNTFSYMMDPLNRTLFFVEDGKRIYQIENKAMKKIDIEK